MICGGRAIKRRQDCNVEEINLSRRERQGEERGRKGIKMHGQMGQNPATGRPVMGFEEILYSYGRFKVQG